MCAYLVVGYAHKSETLVEPPRWGRSSALASAKFGQKLSGENALKGLFVARFIILQLLASESAGDPVSRQRETNRWVTCPKACVSVSPRAAWSYGLNAWREPGSARGLPPIVGSPVA